MEWGSGPRLVLESDEGNQIELLKELHFPHSLGLLYSAFTYFCGFRVNSGEYKLMGLAPYGEPVYADLIRKHLVKIFDDGSIWMDQSYFNYAGGLTMTSKKFDGLFGGPPRKKESPIGKREMDLAASIQVVTEEVMLKMARHAHQLTGNETSLSSGWGGSQLCRERKASPGGTIRRYLGSASIGGCRRGSWERLSLPGTNCSKSLAQ